MAAGTGINRTSVASIAIATALPSVGLEGGVPEPEPKPPRAPAEPARA
jgi:hypothetical protein